MFHSGSCSNAMPDLPARSGLGYTRVRLMQKFLTEETVALLVVDLVTRRLIAKDISHLLTHLLTHSVQYTTSAVRK